MIFFLQRLKSEIFFTLLELLIVYNQHNAPLTDTTDAITVYYIEETCHSNKLCEYFYL